VKKPRKHNKRHNVAKTVAGNLRPATRSKDVIHRDSSGHAFGIDHSTNALLEIREPPRSLILLREELPKHPDIYAAASKEPDFARCLGTIAAMLDIVLDGQYAGDGLCDLLYRALRNRGKHGTSPHLLDPRLVNAEIHETEGSLKLVEAAMQNIAPTRDEFTVFMREHGCDLCENTAVCKRAGKCLGAEAANLYIPD
jgi:hypothetical protein